MTGQLLAGDTGAERPGVNIATVLRYVRRGQLPAVLSARWRHQGQRKAARRVADVEGDARPGGVTNPAGHDCPPLLAKAIRGSGPMRRVTSPPSEGLDARGLARLRRQRSLEWQLATGGTWRCALCRPTADGLEMVHRTRTADLQ
jgi:hypothetical protein